jgi:hypothetical protein
MGAAYREMLEASEHFPFWRGIVAELDTTSMIGMNEENRQCIGSVLFGEKRIRRYYRYGRQQ